MNLLLVLSGAMVISGAVFVYLRTRAMTREPARGQLDLTAADVAALPERIRLQVVNPATTALPASLVDNARRLVEQGFEDAGAYAVEGITGLTVRLLANRPYSMYATLLHHERWGAWSEISTQYPGGNKYTTTTLTGRGLEGRPGHTIVRLPGTPVLDVFMRHCTERPMGVMKPATAALAAQDFENAYLMWRAWRRSQERAQEAKAA